MKSNGFKSKNITEHNIKEDEIQQILTVDFNGKYGEKNIYAVEGMKDISSDVYIIDLVQNLILKCDNDNNLEIEKKNFFNLGIAIKDDGFTLALGSEQTADIFKLYEDEFNIIIDHAAKLFQKYQKEFKAKKLLN